MFKKWSYSHPGTYGGIFDTADRLAPGLYETVVDVMGNPVAVHKPLRSDRVLNFANGPLPLVMREIDTFWASKDHYRTLGVSHKRGILMHGPAGCGKTGIVSAVIEDAIRRDGIAFQVADIDKFKKAIPLVRQIEKDRPITVLLEDIEQIVKKSEEVLLEVMDGSSSIGNGTLFVATTNKLGDIPDRVKWRPSRIDTLIEVGCPTEPQRREYLEFIDKDAGKWASHTDSFTLAMLKEFVIATRIYGKSPESALSTAKKYGGGKA